jgi:integrase/recombinase XerD
VLDRQAHRCCSTGSRNLPDRVAGTRLPLAAALRSLLRFLFVTGRITRELAAAVPTVANRRLGSLPGRLEAGQAALLLGGCDLQTAAGRRDFAILTVLARLGLRACEVAAIQLGDVGWKLGELTVRGKGGRIDHLPDPRSHPARSAHRNQLSQQPPRTRLR